MLTTLCVRLGMPYWAAVAILCVASACAALWYRGHLVDAGIAIEAARRDAIDVERDRQAKSELADANARVRNAQADLDGAMNSLAKLQLELNHEQANSAALQSDLAAGRRRLSVAITGACRAAPEGHYQGAPAAGLDPAGGPATASLDGRAAADLEWLRQTRNDAIVGLQSCAAAYGAVKIASEKQAP